MKLPTALALPGAIIFFAATASAQFTAAFLQNASYWHDGKSEVNFYNADFVRDGQHYQSEVLIILTAESVDPSGFTRVEDAKRTDAVPIIRWHEQSSLARGLQLEQRSLEGLWRTDSNSLMRLIFTGSDGFGHLAQSITENHDGPAITWKYSCDTFRDRVEKALPSPTGSAIFYDELPLRVRTIDFCKAAGSFEIALAPTIVSSKEEAIAFKPATVSYKLEDRAIRVEVKQDKGSVDRFVIDRDFPFLLREWTSADGSRLKLKNSLKLQLAGYGKPGDRERALKDPMLRHPD